MCSDTVARDSFASTEPCTTSIRRDWIDIQCHRGELDAEIIATIAHDALAKVRARLQIDGPRQPVHLLIADGANSCVERVIRVNPRPPGRGYSTYDWFELLFTHELTHLVVRDAWGVPAVLWWEGLAVHLGDDSVRSRLFGSSYHAYCRALHELGSLIPMEPLLRASTYYRRRTDFRVDVQAGSFCGFLLDAYGPQCMGRFVAESQRAISDARLRRHFGDDLGGLCRQWCRFLRTDACDPSLLEHLRARPLGDAPDGPEHCDTCFARIDTAIGCSCART